MTVMFSLFHSALTFSNNHILPVQAILDAWNNPYARSLLLMSSPPTATPYDQSVAKLLVQKLNLDPGVFSRQDECKTRMLHCLYT